MFSQSQAYCINLSIYAAATLSKQIQL